MDLVAALAVIGVPAGTPMSEVRAAYRVRIREVHPDRTGPAATPDGHADAARLTEAWAVVRAAGTTTPTAPSPQADGDARAGAARRRGAPDVAATASDTIGVSAPPDETWVILAEAASEVGEVAYVDRNLGILEAIVRFEGGPSCSLLITLQGRSWGTEAFCTLESIEAAPTPSIAPVMDALLDALTGDGAR